MEQVHKYLAEQERLRQLALSRKKAKRITVAILKILYIPVVFASLMAFYIFLETR